MSAAFDFMNAAANLAGSNWETEGPFGELLTCMCSCAKEHLELDEVVSHHNPGER